MAQRVVPENVRRLILEVDPETVNVTELRRRHRISRWFFWDLHRREDRGEHVLGPRSRAPKSSPVAPRERSLNRLPRSATGCSSTVLMPVPDRSGSSSSRLAPRRPTSRRFIEFWSVAGWSSHSQTNVPGRCSKGFAAERANEWWQIDDTSWTLADGTDVVITDVIDDVSRISPACAAVARMTGTAAFKPESECLQNLEDSGLLDEQAEVSIQGCVLYDARHVSSMS